MYDVEGKYRWVLKSLRAHKLRWNKNESRDQYHRRLKPVLRRVWTETVGVEFCSESPKPGADLFDTRIISKPLALPDKVLEKCLDAAAARSGGALRRDLIAYGLVGYRQKVAPTSIKHLVETARDLDK